MTPAAHGEERLLDLLLQRALEGLDRAEQDELNALLRRHPDVNPKQFDHVIATLDALPIERDLPPLPANLAASVLARIEAQSDSQTGAPAASAVPEAANESNFAWLVAAAASVLAVLGWWNVLRGDAAPAPTTVERPVDPVKQLRERVDQDADALVVPFSSTDDPQGAGVSGDVHWSQARQAGYMRFDGLDVNDPLVEQYQLWIFDGTRDDAHPVDGGVFDIGDDGEVVVPIAAKLLVRQPALFAVTVEPPGGVVVSDRSRLILVAQAP